MRGLFPLFRAELRLFIREPAAAFFTLVFPLMILVTFGSMFGNDPIPAEGGWGAIDLSTQGYVSMIIGTVTLLGLPIVISSYRQYKVFRRMRATPLRPITLIVAHSLVHLVSTVLGLMILLVGGKVLFDLRMPENISGVVIAALVGYLSFAAIGFLVGGVVGTSRTAQVIGNVVYFPQLFLAGAAMPREMFSDTLKRWTEWLPMTQMVNAIKHPWKGEPMDLTALAALTLIGWCRP
jgi:ABC-2 type transport system permease protein